MVNKKGFLTKANILLDYKYEATINGINYIYCEFAVQDDILKKTFIHDRRATLNPKEDYKKQLFNIYKTIKDDVMGVYEVNSISYKKEDLIICKLTEKELTKMSEENLKNSSKNQ